MDIKEQIGNRITQARKELGITIKELAARIGVLSAARISNWEQCTRSPGPAEAKLLAEQLNVSASYLLCLTDNPQGELLLSQENSMRYVPVLTSKEASFAKELINANNDKPSLLFDEREKAVVVDQFNQASNKEFLFAMKMDDTSMQPELNVGDLVVVDIERIPNPGDFVVAYLSYKKQTILRKYGEANDCLFQLLPSNDLWGTVTVKNSDEVLICGVVVELRRYI